MNKKIPKIIFTVVIIGLLFGYPTYFLLFNLSKDIKHETTKWAIIEDTFGNRLAIEPSSEFVWDELLHPEENVTSISIWGTITSYDNLWQFRFEPTSIHVVYNMRSSPSISEIADDLERFLDSDRGIIFDSIKIFEHKYLGITTFIIDITLSLVSIIVFSFYLIYSKIEKRKYAQLINILSASKEVQEGILFELISQKISLSPTKIKLLIKRENLDKTLGLKLTDDRVQFKKLLHNSNIIQIEQQLKNFSSNPQNRLSLEEYNQLNLFKSDLEVALLFFSDDLIYFDKQIKINQLLEIITTILDVISFDDFK